MGFREARRDREPETQTFGLIRENGLPELGETFGRDARTVVFHAQKRRVAFAQERHADAGTDGLRLRQGVDCVVEKIDEDELELHRVAQNDGGRLEPDAFDGNTRLLRPAVANRPLGKPGEIESLELRSFALQGRAHAVENVGRPIDFGERPAEGRLFPRFVAKAPLLHEKKGVQIIGGVRDGLLHFVREHGGELRHGGAALEALKLRAALAKRLRRLFPGGRSLLEFARAAPNEQVDAHDVHGNEKKRKDAERDFRMKAPPEARRGPVPKIGVGPFAKGSVEIAHVGEIGVRNPIVAALVHGLREHGDRDVAHHFG